MFGGQVDLRQLFGRKGSAAGCLSDFGGSCSI